MSKSREYSLDSTNRVFEAWSRLKVGQIVNCKTRTFVSSSTKCGCLSDENRSPAGVHRTGCSKLLCKAYESHRSEMFRAGLIDSGLEGYNRNAITCNEGGTMPIA